MRENSVLAYHTSKREASHFSRLKGYYVKIHGFRESMGPGLPITKIVSKNPLMKQCKEKLSKL